MLFRKKQEHSCSYCIHATQINDGEFQCSKKGTVTAENSCWRFSYDPCKRVPVKPKAPNFTQYSVDDFSL